MARCSAAGSASMRSSCCRIFFYGPRFISVDPVRPSTTDGSNFNRYWYANNNPYKFVDPDGRFGCTGSHIKSVCDSGGVAGMMTSARAADMQRQAQSYAAGKMGQSVRAAGQAVASGAKSAAEAVIPGVGCINNGCSGGEWAVEAATLIPLAKIARVLESAVDAGATIFKTTHYASRLEAAGVDAVRAESIIAKEVAAIRGNMAVGADVAGRLQIDNVLIEYRARLLPNGSVNVGTIFPVKP